MLCAGEPLYSCNEKFSIILVQSIKVNLSPILITFGYQGRVCLSRIPALISWIWMGSLMNALRIIQLSIAQDVALWISNRALEEGVRNLGFKPQTGPEIQVSNFKLARIRDSNFTWAVHVYLCSHQVGIQILKWVFRIHCIFEVGIQDSIWIQEKWLRFGMMRWWKWFLDIPKIQNWIIVYFFRLVFCLGTHSWVSFLGKNYLKRTIISFKRPDSITSQLAFLRLWSGKVWVFSPR